MIKELGRESFTLFRSSRKVIRQKFQHQMSSIEWATVIN